MESKEIRDLMEAYYSIYEAKEEPEMEEGEEDEEEEYKGKKKGKKEKEENREVQIDEIKTATTTSGDRIPNFENTKKAKPVKGMEVAKPLEEDADLFDYLLEYLVAEGYADTNKAALAIMANMSEEWKRSILSEDPIIDFRARGMVGSPGPSIPGAKNKYTKPAPPTQSSTASVTKPVVRGREFTNPPS